ncbi:uncharacterized protein LOC141759392 isoform X2 [Sebastes fasciatus]|uniref:uncharacterized protein LOC141759392 isoform X2 n=1 Tax=Sebastes fasciatus TaxID=394691 RepID=UPI003D9E6A9D
MVNEQAGCFKERRDVLILQADVSDTAATVKTSLTLPDSPLLIILGPMISDQRWMVSIEGQVVCEGALSALGLAVVFTSYYNFNLQYQDHAACTLEFIQRSRVRINPERGTKARQGKVTIKKSGKMVHKKVTSLNPHVCTLLRKLMDFEWDFASVLPMDVLKERSCPMCLPQRYDALMTRDPASFP